MIKRCKRLSAIVSGATLLLFLLAGVSQAASKSLVSVEWLADNLDGKNTVILDVSEFTSYEKGHIPGAVKAFGPWMTKSDDFVGFMAPPEHELVKMIKGFGVNNDSLVVVYDEGTTAKETAKSARALWTLHFLGHDNVALLDGGFAAWTREGQEVSKDPVAPKVGNFTGKTIQSKVTTLSEVKRKLKYRQIVFVDCRDAVEHFGQEKLHHIDRYGHLPGSRLLPASYMTTAGVEFSPSLFREVEVLKEMAAGAGIPEDKSVEIVTYSNHGLSAALNYFVLHDLLGYEHVQLFDGSVLQASEDEDVPMERYRWGYKDL